MKIAHKHLIKYIPSKPTIEDISDKFFQLGHEHEIEDKVFHMDLTPNRGDCLSVQGLVRDLAPFYDINLADEIYEKQIKNLDISFKNNAPKACPNISFLKIEIDENPSLYNGDLKEYFEDLGNKKNNFFTDVSNYVSYEKGQPTHCYDAEKLGNVFSLEIIEKIHKFRTLHNEEISLQGKNLVFLKNNEVINLAGIMGGKGSACSNKSKSVIIECAYFVPEQILGKSTKYNITSDAAHKFERGVDPSCHEEVLRRFIKIVLDHVSIKNIQILRINSKDESIVKIPLEVGSINNILGTNVDEQMLTGCLSKLGFNVVDGMIYVPSYRNDVKTENDIAEELARVIGYDNIEPIPFVNSFSNKNISHEKLLEHKVKTFLIDNGFFEVINNPFINKEENFSIKVDNPLDSNRRYLRTNLEQSLKDNLTYNERRQNDSIKLFEISNVHYFDNSLKRKKVLGIICSGRVGKNYQDFSKKIDLSFVKKIFQKLHLSKNIEPMVLDRDDINSKFKNDIVYLEIDFDLFSHDNFYMNDNREINLTTNFIKYKPISEFPSSKRDISISIQDFSKYEHIQDFLLNFEDELIKDIFIFDFYHNKKQKELKVGFRLVFQSNEKTITDNEVNIVLDKIFKHILSVDGVYIPGFQFK